MRIESYGSVKVYWPDFTRDELIERLREGVQRLSAELPLKKAALFGSWAKDQATAFSDVDLMVIYAGPAREDAYRTVRRVIPIEGLEPHVHSEAEAAKLRSVLDRMLADGSVELTPR